MLAETTKGELERQLPHQDETSNARTSLHSSWANTVQCVLSYRNELSIYVWIQHHRLTGCWDRKEADQTCQLEALSLIWKWIFFSWCHYRDKQKRAKQWLCRHIYIMHTVVHLPNVKVWTTWKHTFVQVRNECQELGRKKTHFIWPVLNA